MAASWDKVNPDHSVDRLPQPYRSINRVVEDILEAVGEEIGVIEAKRRSEESEFALKQALATKALRIPGRVACAHVEPRCPPRLAVGTMRGEACLIDTKRQEIIAQKQAFGEGEPVTCVALSSDATYEVPSPMMNLGTEPKEMPSLHAYGKLMVAGMTTPLILVYNICREKYGTVLSPSCSISVPEPAPAEDDMQRPVVEQLYAKGTVGGIWVVALLYDRSVQVYLCPLGPPKVQSTTGVTSWQEGMERPILEDGEDEDEDEGEEQRGHHGDAGTVEEFANCPKVNQAVYRFELPSLAPLPGLPEPSLDVVTLTAFSVRPERYAANLRVPLLCFVSSTESNIISALSMALPPPPAPPAGLDLDALLARVAPLPGTLTDPATTTVVEPRRRWILPAKTSAVAVSPNGAIYAAGGEGGAIALVNSAMGPWLRTMLPGHYAGVAALSFHRADVLISIGQDSWVHHYCMKTDTLLARFLCGPAPSPTAAVDVAASQMLPLAMTLDPEGGLRIIDLHRGRKLARGIFNAVQLSKDDADAGMVPDVPTADEVPRRLIAVSHGFCVLCQADEGTLMSDATEEAGESGIVQDGGGSGGGSEEAGQSWLVFFESGSVLKHLFPGLPVRSGARPKEIFDNIPLQKAPIPTLKKGHGASRQLKLAGSVAFQPDLDDGTVAHALAPRPPQQPAGRGKGAARAERPGGLAKLTAENLRRLAGGGPKKAARKAGESTLLSEVASMAGNELKFTAGQALALHGVPENWQAVVKRQSKAVVQEKESRLQHIAKRMEQLRKEVGGS